MSLRGKAEAISCSIRLVQYVTSMGCQMARTSFFGAKALGPIRDGLISPHATKDCPRSNGKNSGKAVSPSMGATRIGDVLHPVCRLIYGSPGALRVYEGLQQHHRMAERLLPLDGKPLVAERQNARGPIGNMVLWKNQETAVVAHQVQTIILMAQVPADSLVRCCTLPRWCGKAQKGYPFSPPGSDIPKGLADLGQEAWVMMFPHQLLEMLLFERINGPDKNLGHVQDNLPPG